METRIKILVCCFSLLWSLSIFRNVDATSQISQDLLNVHIIAHTHDDVGWLKTVDQYYYGANQTIQQAGVQYIIDSVVEALQKAPHRKFIYVEVAFFERWWNEQDDATKQVVRGLVANGQLEFINGGYCMNDEASTHYSAVIDQMTQGHLFLYNEFGVRPRIGWHIDPFGHAATQASLFAQMGFDAFFFGRIEYDDHDLRNQTQNMEFVWRGSQSLGVDTQIWSHVLYTDYCYLHGFSFEWGADPIQDDPRLFDVNVKQRCDDFANQVRARAASVRTNNVLIPFGCDFQFQDPNTNFKNMDKIIKYINAHPDVYGMNLFYSTPSIYLDSVHAANLTWSVKTLDFFPYADFEHAYWTGYFTSRPALKAYVRSMNNLLHASDKIFTTSNAILDIDSGDAYEYLEEINSLSEAFSIAQHHDAVSGTEKQHVANDYAKRLSIGQTNVQEMISEVFAKISGGLCWGIASNCVDETMDFTYCPLMNVSLCPATNALSNGKTVVIVAYNPIAWTSSTQYFRIPVPTANVKVVDSDGKDVVFQTMPNEDYSTLTTLVFEVKLPPMGFDTYFIQPVAADSSVVAESEVIEFSNAADLDVDIVFENDYLTVTISKDTGRISNIASKVINLDTELTQDFLWWKSFTVPEFHDYNDQRSGAYIFRPNGTDPFDFGVANPVTKIVTGKLVQEVYQVWNEWVTQVIRLYNGQNHVEFESTVGPIDVDDGFGKEIISRIESDIDSNGYVWTDSQGQEMIERLVNARPDRTFNNSEPIAGNYYPMNTAAYIKDGQRQLTFLTERSRGCASLGDGEFESMLHRRTLWDDARGVDEPINETDVIRTIQYVTFNSPAESARQQRSLSLFLNNPPILAFTTTTSPNDYITQHTTQFTPLKKALPHPLHMLNFKTLSDGRVLIRLHHIYAAGEDAQYSTAVTVDLNTFFNNLLITDLTEMTLTANRPKSELHRLNWKTNSSHNGAPAYQEIAMAPGSTIVTLRPMEIRTFLARVTPINV